MTKKQIKWASQHDWFLFAGKDCVTVYDSLLDKAITIESFKALKIWAGY